MSPDPLRAVESDDDAPVTTAHREDAPPARRLDASAAPPARRGAEIRAYPDGPFLVRGPVTIVDGEGRELRVRRDVVALCRCGRSRRQPICDGTHTPAGFTCAGTPKTGADAGATADLG